VQQRKLAVQLWHNKQWSKGACSPFATQTG
jgi:hypothetical protein